MSEVMALLASAIIAGASLASTSIVQISQTMNTDRNITIEIVNYSERYTLTNPRTYTYSGYCHHPPQPTIKQKTKEVCCFSKTAHTACGSVGVLTYQILSDAQDCVGELALMYSVPYDYNLYENTFALGIFESGFPCDEDLYNQMYYKSGPFIRGNGTGSSITHSDKDAVVKGTMSSAGQAVMCVEFDDKLSNI
ncbi:bryoporin-like isoform X1 [Astyanax mexicanus]|uniref:Bryoporin-like isoform X1 n=2 Tax=Astyanax mexicanus TaxID=7994 RepID=A0A8B9LR74_ASTMX|nr:bryoporin-like isoform X1 [Astyanax mexicanus]